MGTEGKWVRARKAGLEPAAQALKDGKALHSLR